MCSDPLHHPYGGDKNVRLFVGYVASLVRQKEALDTTTLSRANTPCRPR